MFKFLDVFFVIFHTLLIIFNVFGWMSRHMRKWNLATLIMTGGSWFILGIFYGFGYCPLTDWHFQVLHKLGKHDLPVSYIEYLAERISGMDVDSELADTLTLIVFLVAFSISALLNVFDYMKRNG